MYKHLSQDLNELNYFICKLLSDAAKFYTAFRLLLNLNHFIKIVVQLNRKGNKEIKFFRRIVMKIRMHILGKKLIYTSLCYFRI